jgi:hypothetical protein
MGRWSMGPDNLGSVYFGMSTSRFNEPIDQLDVLLLMNRLRRAQIKAKLLVFVAGRYAQLNGRSADELIAGEEEKKRVIEAAIKVIGVPTAPLDYTGQFDPDYRSSGVCLTDDLWKTAEYWENVLRLKDEDGIVDGARNGFPFSKIVDSFEEGIVGCMPDGLTGSLGEMEAPTLYRLFEVAEAYTLRKRAWLNAKIGPEFEQEYDQYIGKIMDIIQLRQPLDFKSRPGCVKPVTPYIGKRDEQRIFLEDSKEEIGLKVLKLSQRADGQPIIYKEGFMNPFVRTAILAVEAAAAQESTPVNFGTRRIFDGGSLLDFFEKAGTERLQRFASVVTECLWAYLVRPIQKEMERNDELGVRK